MSSQHLLTRLTWRMQYTTDKLIDYLMLQIPHTWIHYCTPCSPNKLDYVAWFAPFYLHNFNPMEWFNYRFRNAFPTQTKGRNEAGGNNGHGCTYYLFFYFSYLTHSVCWCCFLWQTTRKIIKYKAEIVRNLKCSFSKTKYNEKCSIKKNSLTIADIPRIGWKWMHSNRIKTSCRINATRWE